MYFAIIATFILTLHSQWAEPAFGLRCQSQVFHGRIIIKTSILHNYMIHIQSHTYVHIIWLFKRPLHPEGEAVALCFVLFHLSNHFQFWVAEWHLPNGTSSAPARGPTFFAGC